MSAYWIVGCSSAQKGKDAIHGDLKTRILEANKLAEDVTMFDVPENMKFGSFDSLIKLVDDMGKFDSQVESVIRRIERQVFDLDSKVELNIIAQRAQTPVEDYVNRFKWDDIKFPRGRNVQDNIHLILSSVQKLDEEVKNKTQQYIDAKQQAAVYSRKEQASHIQRDLVDLLTPETVKDGDFVYSEHLTTLIVVVPRGADADFQTHYHSFDQYVVPGSAERIAPDDKEGNSLWRVVMFKSAVDAFKTSCRTHRYTVRDFVYDSKKFAETVNARESSESELQKQEAVLKRVCLAAFSDAMVAWMHIKAIRTFVEAVLRYGVPPNFGSYLIRIGKHGSKASKLRKELMDVFSKTGGIFGSSVQGGDGGAEGQSSTGDDAADGAEYYPYVYIPFTPLTNRSNA